MKPGMKKALPLIFSAAVLLLTALSCLWLYRHDNKYTHASPQARQGILLLEEGFPRGTVLFLVDGWAYYSGQLLSPRDFSEGAPLPDEYLFIGQYGGFDRGDRTASPHGCATYRLRIRLPEEERQYMLELPEIFSAYRLYINGRELAGMGQPERERYKPATGNRAVTFEAGGTAEIVIAVSDYSHIYSGMVYPPAFGEPDTVSGLLSARLVFRSLLCAAAGIIGLLSAVIGLLSRRRLPVWYGLVCLLFIGYAGYPIWRSFAYTSEPLYALENLSFCGLLLLILLIARAMGGGWKRNWSIPFLAFGGFMVLFTAVVHAALPHGDLRLLAAYSALISLYQWAVAVFLTVTSLRAVSGGAVGDWSLLCGTLALDAALVMDRLLPLHEPIVSGWFVELAAALLVLCVGLAIGVDVAAQYRQHAVLTERLHSTEQLVRVQQTYRDALNRQSEEAQGIRHDLRHHFSVMRGMLEGGQYDALRSYLAQYGQSIPSGGPGRYCEHPVINAIADYYARLAKNHGIALSLRLDVTADLFLADTELGCILSNLLENAVEACLRLPAGQEPWISLGVKSDPSSFSLVMENSAAGERQPGNRNLSAKKKGRVGYGLRSVRAIADRYHGDADFSYQETRGMFISTLLLTATQY